MKTLLRFGGAAAALALASFAAAQDQPPPAPPPDAPPPPPPAYQAPAEEAPPPQPYQSPAPAATPVASVMMPGGLSHMQVQNAIIAALNHRGWSVVSTGEHTVTAHLLHHHVDATIWLSFNRERVDIYSQSYVVGHEPQDRLMEFTRSDWIHNLQHDIPYFASRGE